jgi:hypothetical protein
VRDYNSGSFFSTIEIVECDSFAQTLWIGAFGRRQF